MIWLQHFRNVQMNQPWDSHRVYCTIHSIFPMFWNQMYPIVSSCAHIHLQTWLYFKLFFIWWTLGIIHDWIWFDQTIEYGLFSCHQFNGFIFPLFSSTITISLEFSFECLTYSNLFWVFELQFFRLLSISLSPWIGYHFIQSPSSCLQLNELDHHWFLSQFPLFSDMILCTSW